MTAGATAAAAAMLPTAAAQYPEQPDDVTITGYDDATADIEQYQPLLDISDLEVEPSRLNAWRVTSDDYEYDWYCYWVFYAVQTGASEEDSHLPDREPVYVGVSEGSVETVVTSDWHYSVNQIDDPTCTKTTTHDCALSRRGTGWFPRTAAGRSSRWAT